MTDDNLQPLVKIDQRSIGQLFVGFLNNEGITARLEADGSSYVAMVEPDHLTRASQLFNEFVAQPYHPKYQQAAWQQGELSPDTNESPVREFATRFFEHAGIVTLVVFIACWLVFLSTTIGFGNGFYRELSFFREFNLTTFFNEPIKIIGPAFIHFSWLHIVFNTMWWWQLGGAIESTFSKATLINLFLVSAISANVAQFWVSGPNFGGLSGVVYAVVGFVWWSGWLMPDKGLQLSKAIVGFLLFWLLLGFTDLLPINMANTAHLIGLVSGCIYAWLLSLKINR